VVAVADAERPEELLEDMQFMKGTRVDLRAGYKV
jgi:hypothetical protein